MSEPIYEDSVIKIILGELGEYGELFELHVQNRNLGPIPIEPEAVRAMYHEIPDRTMQCYNCLWILRDQKSDMIHKPCPKCKTGKLHDVTVHV